MFYTVIAQIERPVSYSRYGIEIYSELFAERTEIEAESYEALVEKLKEFQATYPDGDLDVESVTSAGGAFSKRALSMLQKDVWGA